MKEATSKASERLQSYIAIGIAKQEVRAIIEASSHDEAWSKAVSDTSLEWKDIPGGDDLAVETVELEE